MPVTYGPEHAAESQRLISSGGNIYSMATGYVKTGTATRGRGHWVGRKRVDEANPDVDAPDAQGAQQLIDNEREDDGFEDDIDPLTRMNRPVNVKLIVRQQRRDAQAMVEAMMGRPVVKKAVLTVGADVDLLLANPNDLSEEDLLKSVQTLSFLYSTTDMEGERELLAAHAARVSAALRKALEARQAVAKAILTKPAAEKQPQTKEAKRPPAKAQTTQVNDKGKVAYKYDKKNGGKGPAAAAGNGNGKGPKTGAPAEPQITPPQPVDPAPFCKLLGVGPENLARFAKKKTRTQFVDFFMGQDKLVSKHNITAAMLAQLYDSLTAPPAPDPSNPAVPSSSRAPSQVGPAAPGPTNPLTKSIIVFNGATLDRHTRALIDLLKSHKADTVFDIRACLQKHFACTDDVAQNVTNTLLRRWEGEGLVSIFPAE